MKDALDISVVIPTCNRRARVLAQLHRLTESTHALKEVLVVDASDQKLAPADLAPYASLRVRYIEASKSVCIQRNIGIGAASSPWILLLDDDNELPPDYLARLAAHVVAHPEAGAVSGLVLEGGDGDWQAQFPETSDLVLLWKYLFKLGVWGEPRPRGRLGRALAERYRRAGNHLAKSGWPVIVRMDAPFFRVPIYTLGASLVKRAWLLASPYDENLESHGLGDNYGVAVGFPGDGIHVLADVHVRHHRAPENRLAAAAAAERRMFALDYFIRTRRPLAAFGVRPAWFLWSLVGGAMLHGAGGNGAMASAFGRALWQVVRGRNPYLDGRGAVAFEVHGAHGKP
jgi:glycosyltransferase involved in cell wall biosynthesis